METSRVQHVDKLKPSQIECKIPSLSPENPFKCYHRISYVLWLSEEKCNATHVMEIRNLIRKEDPDQSIHINSGTHGDENGNTSAQNPNNAEIQFYLEDEKTIVDDTNSSIHIVSSYSPAIYPSNANHIINAWCFSAKSPESHKSLLLLPKRQVTDPIHGMMHFPSLLWKFIDTPQFQRLRYLKQLGGLSYVFPGASHNRFEHSLGVCFLASQWMKHLQEQYPSLVEDRDVLLVQIAALCHDLGHGPFSHSFEKLAKKINSQWYHEKVSCELLQKIHDQQTGKVLSPDDLFIVKSLILNGKTDPEKECDVVKKMRAKKPFLWDIVASKNGLDVDKMDYLLRDKYCCGVQTVSFEYTRIMQASFIDTKGKLTFLEREAYNIFQIFTSRVLAHRKIYSHPVGMSIELMINDILDKNQDYLNLLSIIQEKEGWLDQFTSLTDAILLEIERNQKKNTEHYHLIKRLLMRDLYTLVGQARIENKQKKNVSSVLNDVAVIFPEELYKVEVIRYDYGPKLKDPLTEIYFGVPGHVGQTFSRGVEDVSSLLPSGSNDQIIRIYYTGPKESFAEDMLTNFHKLLQSHKYLIQQSIKLHTSPPNTPQK